MKKPLKSMGHMRFQGMWHLLGLAASAGLRQRGREGPWLRGGRHGLGRRRPAGQRLGVLLRQQQRLLPALGARCLRRPRLRWLHGHRLLHPIAPGRGPRPCYIKLLYLIAYTEYGPYSMFFLGQAGGGSFYSLQKNSSGGVAHAFLP